LEGGFTGKHPVKEEENTSQNSVIQTIFFLFRLYLTFHNNFLQLIVTSSYSYFAFILLLLYLILCLPLVITFFCFYSSGVVSLLVPDPPFFTFSMAQNAGARGSILVKALC
jgi:hypothetical protein